MLNNITLVGYMAHDPDLRSTINGSSICRFAVANTRPIVAGKEREVDFIDVVALDKKAEFIGKWFKKGDPISIVGRLQTRFLVEEDGRSKKLYEVLVSAVDFVPKRKSETENEATLQ